MANAVFIHAANMIKDVTHNPCEGLCQQILDRIAAFMEDAKIYEGVDLIHLGYVGKEGLTLNLPKTKIEFYDPDIYQWEFPTLQALRKFCNENPDGNVCYVHTQAVSQGFYHPKFQMFVERRDYHLYWNLTKYKTALEILKECDTCGAMLVPLNADLELVNGRPRIVKLHDNPVWHYSQNFWWSRANHVNTLPDPESYPQILDKRHQAEFWLCSSTNSGTHGSIHNLFDSWCYAEDFKREDYMDPEDLERLSSIK